MAMGLANFHRVENMKQNDEELCKLRFNEYLTNFFPEEIIKWEDVPKESEPPDYYLLLNEIQYAVEVTDLVEKIDVGTKRLLPREEVNKTFVDFVKDVERIAKKNDWLSGAYTVNFRRPIKNFRKIRAELQEQILDYIRSTKELDSAPDFKYFIGHFHFCQISKSHNKIDIIYPFPPASAKFEGQSNQESITLLVERLKVKINKLRNLSVPTILLILDTNLYFPNKIAFSKAIPLLPEISCFHTVFIVSPVFGDFVLHSKNKEWK